MGNESRPTTTAINNTGIFQESKLNQDSKRDSIESTHQTAFTDR